jgi:hypothetical protein
MDACVFEQELTKKTEVFLFRLCSLRLLLLKFAVLVICSRWAVAINGFEQEIAEDTEKKPPLSPLAPVQKSFGFGS